VDLEIELSVAQAKAMQYLCDEWNRTHSIPESGPKTVQNLFEEQCNYYIKQMLKTVVPVNISSDILNGLTDEEESELTARTINNYSDFVKTELNNMTVIPEAQKSVFRKFLDKVFLK